jgi:DNA replication protein DnaC
MKDLLPKAVETLAQPTKANPPSTEVLDALKAFKTVVPDDQDWVAEPQLVQMKNAAAQFMQDMLDDQNPHWLSFLGPSGAGKTMLARIIASIYRKKLDGGIIEENPTRIVRRHGGFVTWAKLVGELREKEYRMFDDICADWFVCLDDIGSEQATPFTNSKLYDFCARREKKWTVFTANLSLEQVSARETRIASRMIRHGSVVCDVDLPDWNTR